MPAATDNEMSEAAWQNLRAQAGFAATDRRVQRLRYKSHRSLLTSEVGYIENDDMYDWLTTAIFEPAAVGTPWMISIMRIADGEPVWRNPPILVGAAGVVAVTDFLPAE